LQEKPEQQELQLLAGFIKDNPCFVGEIGLDKISAKNDRNQLLIQESLFRQQLQLAKQFNKPVVLHVVRMHHRVFEILDEFDFSYKGFVHGYNGSVEMAKEYINRGLKVSIGPQLLKSDTNKLVEVVRQLELNQLLIESDHPANQKNSNSAKTPAILAVAQRVCQIKNVSFKQFKEESEENLTSLLEGFGF
jgi:TatD DNase family protein